MSSKRCCAPSLLLALLAALALLGVPAEAQRVRSLDLIALLPVAEVSGPEGTGEKVRAAGGQLSIPDGFRVDYYARLPSGASLETERLRSGEGGRLEVVVQADSGEAVKAARLAPGDDPKTILLPETGRVPVRLSLLAVGGGLVLTRPAVSAPGGLALPSKTGAPASVPAGRPRNVILYLVDTLRADHLGCYGYDKPVSPAIDAFARESTLFRDAVAQSPWTRPSAASLLTGLWPGTHKVNGRRDALAPEALTLAEVLKGRGYRTAAFVTNGNVAKSFGLGQGFDTYELLPRRAHAATDVNAKAEAWLEAGAGEPFLLFLHTVEPHSPYDPPPAFRERFAPGIAEGVGKRRWLKRLAQGQIPVTPGVLRQLLALYDAEIAAGDAAFGELVTLLKRRGLWEETAVVFVSDHGEEFHEHGDWEHGKTLHAEVLEIPLIVRLPGLGAGRTVARQAQHIDVLPTLLAYLGIPVPERVEGRNLLPLIAGEPDAALLGDDRVFSWMEIDGRRGGAVSTPDWRLIDLAAPGSELDLFDRWRDPGESRDLAAERPVAVGYLRALLKARTQERHNGLKAGEGAVNEELREQLRALGYVD
jgi:arylsulfatase A-like enzyme